MKSGSKKSTWIFAILGIFPVIWFALLTAPYLSGGLMGIVKGLPEAMDHPFSMELCKDSAKTVLLFLLAYGLGIGIYLSTRRKYRRGEEHGSAVWGDVREINRKYSEKNFLANKLMTQNVRISYQPETPAEPADHHHRREWSGQDQVLCETESHAGEYVFCGT